MTGFRLRLTTPDTVSAQEAQASFYWITDRASSFTTGLDPSLRPLGPVPPLNIDLVRIAVAVYAADRSTYRSRRGSDWNQRELEVEVPVSNAAAWTAVAGDVTSVLDFLTGDRWSLSFNEEIAPTPIATADKNRTKSPKRVVLLSGGADSAIGALVSRSDLAEGDRHVLVSHVSFTPVAPLQRTVASTIERLIPGPEQQHLQLRLSRNARRIDGSNYATESSSRSRSLLFLALGLAVAAIHESPLWIPENGFASLNPPLGPDRRGSLSTRTTHPAFLGGLTDVLQTIGAHGVIENPFGDSTKGEMFARAAGIVGTNHASAFLSNTNSCAHTGQRSFGISPTQACGVCFGCFVRRASFAASGLQDGTSYISSDGNTKLNDWLDGNSVVPAVRSFVRRGVRERDIIALSLPPSYPIADALELCRRGIHELAGFLQ
jgi:hypothetical protein